MGRTEDLNLSTVSAQTVLFSRLFQSTIVHVEKLYLKMAALVVSTAFSNLHLDSFVSRFKKKNVLFVADFPFQKQHSQ